MTPRAVFHEDHDALAVATRLRADGFAAQVSKERFAGEDDDEDHAWAVDTDAPDFVLELFLDEHDGWLDGDGPAEQRPRGAVPPLDLPDGPRRVKGHWSPESGRTAESRRGATRDPGLE